MFGVGGWFAYQHYSNVASTTDLELPPPHEKASGKAPVVEKKESKEFVFAPVGDSGVRGDGSATLKTDLTSFGLRLVSAPEPKAGESYEAYIILKEGTDPQLIGEFVKIKSANEKYIAGGAGATSWYVGEKIIITKRGAKDLKPGTIVAEGSLAQAKKQ